MENKELKEKVIIYSNSYYKSKDIKEPEHHFEAGANYMLDKIKEDIEPIKDIIGRKPKKNEPEFINEIWYIINKY